MTQTQEHSAEVLRATELDAAGRHDDAINELARAAHRGDVEATTQLAKRIIVGDRAPCLARQGIRLLEDAVNLGGAEAADRLAVIRANGAGGAPDWPGACRLLALAAGRGWEPSRDQLEILASMIGDAREDLIAGKADREALERMLLPAAGSILHDDPRICVFPEFVSFEVCDWLIGRARARLERARVYDVVKQADFVDESRSNSMATFHVMDADLVHLLVQTRIAAAAGLPVSHMEVPTVLHYGVGETIGNHYDFVDPAHPGYAEEIRKFGFRSLTFLVYLNEGYSGGETVFPRIGVTHPGQRGEGLYFVNTLSDGQADVRTLHSGLPPTLGEKWVFSQFVRDRPQLPSD